MFFARKISLAKWSDRPTLAAGEISADAVTADLRTKDDTLSFWRCGSGTAEDVDTATLAIAAAGNRIDKLDLVWIASDELDAEGQSWTETEGETPVRRLRSFHIDIVSLDYRRLGRVAHCIARSIEHQRFRRVPRGRVLEILGSAVRDGHVEIGDLKEGVRKALSRSVL